MNHNVLFPGVVIKTSKQSPLQPVEFEYRLQRDESTAVVWIRPLLKDGGRSNCVERVQVQRVISIFYLGETSAEIRQSMPGAAPVMRAFLEQLINQSHQDLAVIDAIHRRLVATCGLP